MINICSHGDPLNPKTWSGTPENICRELLKNDLLGKTIDFTLNPIFRKPLHLLSRIYYNQKPELNRGKILKIARSSYVALSFSHTKSLNILHMSNMGLPMFLNFKNQKHFLYLDSTWNMWSSYSSYREEYSSLFVEQVEELEFKMYQQLEHIFTVSKCVKTNLIEHYQVPESKITVVGTGRGKIQPYFGTKEYANKEILFIAKNRFIDKGGPLLIHAFNEVSNHLPGAKLHIVGLDNHISTYLNKNIIIHGFLPLNELETLFNKCSLFVMPSLNEPWGLVYLEALACKIPIVGMNRNAFPEISNDGGYGFLLNNNDHNELADIIIKAFSDPKELERKGKEGQDWCLKNFSWENTVNKMILQIL